MSFVDLPLPALAGWWGFMTQHDEQGELFPPFQRHSQTSLEAAESMTVSAGTERARVFEYLKSCQEYGSTDEQVQEALGMNPSTQRPRRRELQLGGMIKDSGKTRLTHSGRKAVVWVITKRSQLHLPHTTGP